MSINKYKVRVGEQLRMERRMRELSQREAGEGVGVHAQTIMLSERGEVSLDALYAYATWLGLDWSKLTCVALEVCDE